MMDEEVMHRRNPSLNNRLEQVHRGIKQRYYPMRGFGYFDAATRFCAQEAPAFDEQRQYFRLRPRMGQPLPPLSKQRREQCARFQALLRELMAA